MGHCAASYYTEISSIYPIGGGFPVAGQLSPPSGLMRNFRRVENPVHRVLVAVEILALARKHQIDHL